LSQQASVARAMIAKIFSMKEHAIRTQGFYDHDLAMADRHGIAGQ
jgi:hypothetical protein